MDPSCCAAAHAVISTLLTEPAQATSGPEALASGAPLDRAIEATLLHVDAAISGCCPLGARCTLPLLAALTDAMVLGGAKACAALLAAAARAAELRELASGTATGEDAVSRTGAGAVGGEGSGADSVNVWAHVCSTSQALGNCCPGPDRSGAVPGRCCDLLFALCRSCM